MSNPFAIPHEKQLKLTANRRNISIGLPTPAPGCDRRFPLTPEAAGLLVERGFSVKIQQGGAESIHYPDFKYQQQGVDIVRPRRSLPMRHRDIPRAPHQR